MPNKIITINGYDFVRHGEIFTAREPDNLWASRAGFEVLVLGGSFSVEKKLNRVRGIIRGYENQELTEQDEQRSRVHQEYMRGIADKTEEDSGTFGR